MTSSLPLLWHILMSEYIREMHSVAVCAGCCIPDCPCLHFYSFPTILDMSVLHRGVGLHPYHRPQEGCGCRATVQVMWKKNKWGREEKWSMIYNNFGKTQTQEQRCVVEWLFMKKMFPNKLPEWHVEGSVLSANGKPTRSSLGAKAHPCEPAISCSIHISGWRTGPEQCFWTVHANQLHGCNGKVFGRLVMSLCVFALLLVSNTALTFWPRVCIW